MLEALSVFLCYCNSPILFTNNDFQLVVHKGSKRVIICHCKNQLARHSIIDFSLLFMLTGSSDEAQAVEESIKLAKHAVSLDVKDGQSWCKSSYLSISSIKVFTLLIAFI